MATRGRAIKILQKSYSSELSLNFNSKYANLFAQVRGIRPSWSSCFIIYLSHTVFDNSILFDRDICQVKQECHIQEGQLLLSFFLSTYLPWLLVLYKLPVKIKSEKI